MFRDCYRSAIGVDMTRSEHYVSLTLAMCMLSLCSCHRESISKRTASRNPPPESRIAKSAEEPMPRTRHDTPSPTSPIQTPLASKTVKNPVESSTDRSRVADADQSASPESVSRARIADKKSMDQSPQATHQTAMVRQKKATGAAHVGDLKTAYIESLAAWESLREFPDDDACRKLAAELFKELEAYGEKLSSSSRATGLQPNSVDKPIRFE